MKKKVAIQEAALDQQSIKEPYKLDLLGWVSYGIGFFFSVSGRPQVGAIMAAIGLTIVIMFYYSKPKKDILKLEYKTREIINNTLLIAFAVFLFLLKSPGLAIFCLGLNFFLFGCLSLKGEKIYVGTQLRLQDRTCYLRKTQPERYWLWTIGFLSLGYLCLIFLLLLNR